MGERIFCPGCGVAIDDPGRYCPSCQEPLPAPKTYVGFGDPTAERLGAPAPTGPENALDTIPEKATEPPLESTWNSFSDELPAKLQIPVPSGPAQPEPRAQATFPGHPGPAVAAPVVAPAAEPALPPASQIVPSKMAVSVREPPVLGEVPDAGIGLGLGGSTTPGFPEAPAVARKQTLKIEPAEQPGPSPAAVPPPPIAQQPALAQPSAPLAAIPPEYGTPQQAGYVAPQAPANYAAAQPPQAQPVSAYVPPQPQVAQPVAGQPQSPTEPREGPPAAAFAPPPQQPFVYGQPAPPIVPAAPAAVVTGPTAPPITRSPSELAPTDTRKGLVWRTITGGALLTWTLLYGLTACVFIAVHLVLFLKYGLANMHPNTFATFGVAATALIPAALLMITSVSCLSGRGWPRATGVLAALTHVGWAGAGLYVVLESFKWYRTAKYGAIACGVSALLSIVVVVLLLSAGKWVSRSSPGKPARAVPYPLWGGSMLIVLGFLSIVREAIPLVQVGFRAAKASRFKYAAEKFYESYPLFWAGAAGLLFSIVLVVAGIALLRRKRWAVGLGGAAGLLTLIADLAAILTLYIGDDIDKHGGALLGIVDMLVLLAFGVTAWVALAAAARYGFRLPRYLRDAPLKGEDGKRLGLLQVLVPPGTPPAQQP